MAILIPGIIEQWQTIIIFCESFNCQATIIMYDQDSPGMIHMLLYFSSGCMVAGWLFCFFPFSGGNPPAALASPQQLITGREPPQPPPRGSGPGNLSTCNEASENELMPFGSVFSHHSVYYMSLNYLTAIYLIPFHRSSTPFPCEIVKASTGFWTSGYFWCATRANWFHDFWYANLSVLTCVLQGWK